MKMFLRFNENNLQLLEMVIIEDMYKYYCNFMNVLIKPHNIISTQNSTPCMSEIRHFSVAFSTHAIFFAVGGITSDLRHPTNVGRRSDTPWCHLFDRFLFQSVNQNLHKPSKIRRHSTLVASAFRRTKVSEEWQCRRYFYPKSVGCSTLSDT